MAADDWNATVGVGSGSLTNQTVQVPGLITALAGYAPAPVAGAQALTVVAGDVPAWQIAAVEILPASTVAASTQFSDPSCVPPGFGSTTLPSLPLTGTVAVASGIGDSTAVQNKALHFTGSGMAATAGTVPVVAVTANQATNYTVAGCPWP